MYHDNPEVVCFGEVLWDNLPHGCFPGGAPMNVAIHLFHLGVSSAVISKVGEDTLGADITTFIGKSGVSISEVQTDKKFETGIVQADVSDPLNVKYDIKRPVAWDFIEFKKDSAVVISKAKMFIFGSLAIRNSESETALLGYIKHANYCVFDVNLRAPHYSEIGIKKFLKHADFVKMNEEELALIASWFGEESEQEDQIKMLSDKLKIDTICVTLGADGAILYDSGKLFKQLGYKVAVADTIGSGDSFLAALLSKRLGGSEASKCLEYACAVGAYVASQNGATPSIDLEEINTMIN